MSDHSPFVSGSNEIVSWLQRKCQAHVAHQGAQEALTAEYMASQIMTLCQRYSSDDALLQASLFDLIGESGFELILEIMEQVQNIAAVKDLPTQANSVERTITSNDSMRLQYNDYVDESKLSANQRRKLQQKREILEQEELNEVLALSNTTSGMMIGATNGVGGGTDWLQELGFGSDHLMIERALGLQGGAVGGSHERNYNAKPEHWLEGLAKSGSTDIAAHDQLRTGLPAGAQRSVRPGFEEFHFPAPQKKANVDENNNLVPISTLEDWAQLAFRGTKQLNAMQSKCFSCAYYSNENMLLCAPTGAGKTNVAMLTFLQLVRRCMNINDQDGSYEVNNEQLRAVYIAPMKALAQEVVAKFGERLAPLGLKVREFTGDMQLTRAEIADSHMLVSTPEKFDVCTRKGGDGSLANQVSLLIIDEVHLLAEERGAVIETIVARMQRYVESSQQPVRIVGLSATLPNYKDVALFLRVNMQTGLHFFGPEYRPVPLEQSFIGVTEKQRNRRMDHMNRAAYDKMVEALLKGKQVMIFVHARKDTSKTAEALVELCCQNGTDSLLENYQHDKYLLFKKQVDKSRSGDVRNLFEKGFGIHHAGMLRSDRSMTEQMFECGAIKVLCCTATLAWGVNLPAHTVIVKGTELYDPERGGYVDLSMLDVLQIFGRAGRPQYDNTGHAILVTPHASLTKYLGLLAHQAPIESTLIKALPDHLNAEVVNGTVTNISDAATWLSYTFLFVRMCKNPIAYGLKAEERYSDPLLQKKRTELVIDAAQILDRCMMVRYDRRSGNLAVTNLGRIASHFYISHETVEAFNSMLSPHLLPSEALNVLCSASEFDQLKVRPEELPELDQLKAQSYRGSTKSKSNRKLVVKDPVDSPNIMTVAAGVDETPGKVAVLLRGYLSNSRIHAFTLQSDTNYIAQNCARICRALFEMCLKRGWSGIAVHYLELAKCIDRRMLPGQTPLRQFQVISNLSKDLQLPVETLAHLEAAGYNSVDKLRELHDGREAGQLAHNKKAGSLITRLSWHLPMQLVEVTLQPITRSILRLTIYLRADFKWADRFHGGGSEPFWVWVEDADSEFIYHSEHLLLTKQEVESGFDRSLEVLIPVTEPLPSQCCVRVVSDRWVGCDRIVPVSFSHLRLPSMPIAHTDLLDIHPVPITALQDSKFERLFRDRGIAYFNPIQSQTFHALYHSDANLLIGAPTGSGKTITAELALLRLLRQYPGMKAVYVAPLKALARERLSDWQKRLGHTLGLSVLELTGDSTPDMRALQRADLLIVTPEKWDSISRGWRRRKYVQQVRLMIIDEIHLLGVERGAVLEVIVSRMRFISAQLGNEQIHSIRFIGLSTALANPDDLGDWLGCGTTTTTHGTRGGRGVFNFRPSVRPIPMTTHIQGFPGQHYCPRMATMNKPAYAAILEHSPQKPSLIFVSSRRQTRLTALDLISLCAADENPKRFLHMDSDDIEAIASTLHDNALKDTIIFGVAIHHAGLHNHDRSVVQSLFSEGKIQVLVCTSTLAWGVNLPCHLVIVKGTEYFDGKLGRYVDMPVTDVLQMIGRAGRPQYDKSGVACVFVHEPKKTFYRKFLHEPFPVESSLHLPGVLHNHINAEISLTGSLHTLQDCIEYLTWTYYFRRLLKNISYYGLEPSEAEQETVSDGSVSDRVIEKHLTQFVVSTLQDLKRAGCIKVITDGGDDSPNLTDGQYLSTHLGMVAAYYYLNYRTPLMFRDRLNVLVIEEEEYPIPLAEEVSEAGSIASPYSYYTMQLLVLLCDAYEFAELPVRHNEEFLNAQLAEDIDCIISINAPGGSSTSISEFLLERGSFKSPHSKAFLLLLVHLLGSEKIKLPISDYVNDTNSILDQISRVLNALVDVAAEEGLMRMVMRLFTMSQMLQQGEQSQVQSELSQLPILKNDPRLVQELERSYALPRVGGLAEFLVRIDGESHSLVSHFVKSSNAVNDNSLALLEKVLGALPVFEVVSVIVQDSQNMSYQKVYDNDNNSAFELAYGTVYKATVQLVCHLGRPGARIPNHWKKSITTFSNHLAPSFTLLLGLEPELEYLRSSNYPVNKNSRHDGSCGLKMQGKSLYAAQLSADSELLALKRIHNINSLRKGESFNAELEFELPQINEEEHMAHQGLVLHLACDACRGLDSSLVIPITAKRNMS